MNRSAISLTFTVFLLLSLSGSNGIVAEQPPRADWYVAPDGNDQNPGTMERPFATVNRARLAVGKAKQDGMTRDVTVLIRGGRYLLTEPMRFGWQDSGTKEHAITYAAFPGERPIFSGGVRIKNWTRGKGGTWTARMPEAVTAGRRFQQLFVNGCRRPSARHPNEGYSHIVSAGEDNRTSFQFHDGDLRQYANLAEAEIVFFHDWSISRVGVKSIDEASKSITLAHPIGAGSHNFFRITGFEKTPRYYVNGAVELLDAPGEWHFDYRSGVVSYIPLSGEDPKQTEVIAPIARQLLVIGGEVEQDRRLENLHFIGLGFAHCAVLNCSSGYAGIQAGFHEQRGDGKTGQPWDRMPAAIVFHAAVGCEMRGCEISHIGGTAVSLEGPSEKNQIMENEIFDVGGNGVMVGETTTAVAQLAKDNVISRNHIHHAGTVYHGCVGVWAGITEGTVVSHNEIHDLPYTGISVGWMWNTSKTPCGKNVIAHNHIHHIMQKLSDGGGIYTLGRQPGTVLRGNVIHDVRVNAGRAESNGLFIDEGSSELLIEENTIFNIARSPIRFHKAENNLIRGNFLVTPRGIPAFRYNATKKESMRYERNQVFNIKQGGRTAY